MKLAQLEEWANHPVTKEYVALMKEHRQASRDYIALAMQESASVRDIDLFQIAEYRGQIYTFDLVLDVETFLDEKIERKDNEKFNTIGSEFNS
jgi:tRNA isopentenyl-2-thiomethyl-A-37 hydroxylase MiaE